MKTGYMLATRLSMHLVLAAAALLPAVHPRASCRGEPCSPVREHAPAEPRQDPKQEQYAALLRAMVVLKIAPYLTREQRPDDPDDTRPYTLAVVGNDEVAAAMLRHLPGKLVGQRPLRVVEVEPGELTDGEGGPHFELAYVARSLPRDAVTRIVTDLRKVATPLIADRPGFAADGGGVQLFVEDNAVRFEVNVAALRKQGLKASSQLLKLSRKGPRR